MKKLTKIFAGIFLAAILLTASSCQSLMPLPSTQVDAEHQHSFTASIRPATCTSQSDIIYTCVCGEMREYPDGEPLPHDFVEWQTELAATCEKDGSRSRTCQKCAFTEMQIVAQTGHSFGEWETVKTATPALDGLQRRICTACALVENQTTPATGSLGLEIEGGTVVEIGKCTDSDLYIPTTADKVADRAFVNCVFLTSVTFSSSVVSVGYRAFYNCPSLAAVTIPANVKSVGAEAFGECTSLKYIYFEGTKEKFDTLFANTQIPDSVTVVYK